MVIHLTGERWHPDTILATLGQPRASRLVLFDVDLTLVGYFFEDKFDIRPGARETIEHLVASGWEVALWSGGGQVHAQEIADLMDINHLITGTHRKVEYPMSLSSVVEKFGQAPVAMFDDEENVEGILSIINDAYEGEGIKRLREEGAM
jgi:hydroxymethylpyrimidine pyrophosphatase-like HAD family hydrolase